MFFLVEILIPHMLLIIGFLFINAFCRHLKIGRTLCAKSGKPLSFSYQVVSTRKRVGASYLK